MYLSKQNGTALGRRVFAINQSTVAKTNEFNSHAVLELEALKLKHANSVNDLLVKFVDLKTDADGVHQLLMERIYPLQYRALDNFTKYALMQTFEKQLKELHESGFVFNDLCRTVITNSRPADTINPGTEHFNFMLTPGGIRLIDAGLSQLRSDVGDSVFDSLVQYDLQMLKNVRRIIGCFDHSLT